MASINPATINLGDWYIYDLAMDVRCSCGHHRLLHASELIQMYGARSYLDQHKLEDLRRRLICRACGRRESDLVIGSFPA